MRYGSLFAVVLSAVIFQTTVAPYLTIHQVTPHALLATVVTLGLLFGLEIGLMAGLVGGLLFDLVFGRFVGLSVLSLGLAGLMAGLVEHRVYKENWLIPLLGGAFTTLVHEGLTLAILAFFGVSIQALVSLRQIALPAMVYNSVVTLAIYAYTYRHYGYLRPNPRGQISIVRRG